MKLVSWNIARSPEAWRELAAATDVDVALLQEAVPPPSDVSVPSVLPGSVDWRLAGWEDRPSCTAIAQLSDRVRITPLAVTPLVQQETADELAVSRPGSIAAADVVVGDAGPITVVSSYAAWERPLGYATDGWIYADGNAHRLISDVAALIGTLTRHRILLAGDWNLLRGYGEDGDQYWKRRYDGVFGRLDDLGLRFIGPHHPHGQQADPWPDELPSDSANVPTYRRHRGDPATATRQLDFVFASHSIADNVTTEAANSVGDWGPSDHCRVLINIEMS